jgi:hypothetical protein
MKQISIIPNTLPTAQYRIVALDPSIRGSDRKVLTALIEIPNEQLAVGPRGYRVQVIDYDTTSQTLYAPQEFTAEEARAVPDKIETDRAFHARNTYAIVMRVLARFERALGRRVAWSFLGHQLTVAPHAFHDLNAFYSKDDRAIFFGYFRDAKGNVFTCLSHEVIAHETTHALLDGLRPNYTSPSSADQAAFHEGFSDIVALLSVLSLREVVSAALDLNTSTEKTVIRASELTIPKLKKGVLLGLAPQLGEAMSGGQGVALRRSIEIDPDPLLAGSEEYDEPHRRGELVVAAVLGAFLAIWKYRIDLFGQLQDGMVSRIGVTTAAVETADHLLTIAIRALDYCPSTDLTFSDFLSAMLTSDYEVYPDDTVYGYREALRKGFESFGFHPVESGKPTAEPGMWEPSDAGAYVYSRTHFDSLQHNHDEVFRFVWENRDKLKINESAYTKVEAVWPCHRYGSDGFLLRETVAVYSQQLRIEARELSKLRLKRPQDMPLDTPLTIYGGGTLIFDETGRLKYHISNRIGGKERQDERLQYLWDRGNLNKKKTFAALHLERMLRNDLSRGNIAGHAHEDEGDAAEAE